MKIALAQFISSEHHRANLAKLEECMIKASQNNAQMLIVPEFFIQISDVADKFAIAEEFGNGAIQQQLAKFAQQYQIYLVAGTIPLCTAIENKYSNSCLVFAPTGEIITRYDKIHLFRLNEANENYNEAVNFVSGDKVITFSIGEYKFGLAICYDLRFPELFRRMGKVDAIILPSAFTKTTGKAHWEILCRARAIENQCYMMAVNQGGTHPNGRNTYGHTMAIDPWGQIIVECETGEYLVYFDIDKSVIERYRNKLPALEHRIFE